MTHSESLIGSVATNRYASPGPDAKFRVWGLFSRIEWQKARWPAPLNEGDSVAFEIISMTVWMHRSATFKGFGISLLVEWHLQHAWPHLICE